MSKAEHNKSKSQNQSKINIRVDDSRNVWKLKTVSKKKKVSKKSQEHKTQKLDKKTTEVAEGEMFEDREPSVDDNQEHEWDRQKQRLDLMR